LIINVFLPSNEFSITGKIPQQLLAASFLSVTDGTQMTQTAVVRKEVIPQQDRALKATLFGHDALLQGLDGGRGMIVGNGITRLVRVVLQPQHHVKFKP
jgi:hypothetical protein